MITFLLSTGNMTHELHILILWVFCVCLDVNGYYDLMEDYYWQQIHFFFSSSLYFQFRSRQHKIHWHFLFVLLVVHLKFTQKKHVCLSRLAPSVSTDLDRRRIERRLRIHWSSNWVEFNQIMKNELGLNISC